MKLYVDEIYHKGEIGFTVHPKKVKRNLELLPLQEKVDEAVKAGRYNGIVGGIGRWVIVYEPHHEKPHFIFIDVNNDLKYLSKNEVFDSEALNIIHQKQAELLVEGYDEGVELTLNSPK